jgi:antitoxin component YwqK of YwqJK toxin-antitoxin module
MSSDKYISSLYLQAITKPKMSSIIQNSQENSMEVLNGKFVTYHDNGCVKEEGTYIDGMLQGVFHEYDENGKLIVQSYWKDHKLHGKLTHWRDVKTGVLYETTMYSNDLRVWTNMFDENSMISANYYYSDGVCVKSVEYKRLSDGGCILATTIPGFYSEEFIHA